MTQYMTLGDAYFYKNKCVDLETSLLEAKEREEEKQVVIDAYGLYFASLKTIGILDNPLSPSITKK